MSYFHQAPQPERMNPAHTSVSSTPLLTEEKEQKATRRLIRSCSRPGTRTVHVLVMDYPIHDGQITTVEEAANPKLQETLNFETPCARNRSRHRNVKTHAVSLPSNGSGSQRSAPHPQHIMASSRCDGPPQTRQQRPAPLHLWSDGWAMPPICI